MNETESPPKRKRAKQQALTDASGEELRPLDDNGEPITEGVVNAEVRERVEEYSAATWRYGQSKIDKDDSEELLKDAMHRAGVESCVANDAEGIAYRFRLTSKEGIKREKLKAGEDD